MSDPFQLLHHSTWHSTLPSVRIATLKQLSVALHHLEEDDDIVSRSWRILHRSLLDIDPLFRHVGLRSVHHSIVSWRDPYFHHNPNAIDRLLHAFINIASSDISLRTRVAAIDTIGQACVALSEHLNDSHPKDSTSIILYVGKWIVQRLINCLNNEQKYGWNEVISTERVHYIYSIGLLYKYCGDYLNSDTSDGTGKEDVNNDVNNIDIDTDNNCDTSSSEKQKMYNVVLYLLHEIVSKSNNASKRKRNNKKNNGKKNAAAASERQYEDRAVFYILNHCLEDNLHIGQIFLNSAKVKGQLSLSVYSRSEILSFLGTLKIFLLVDVSVGEIICVVFVIQNFL